MILESNIWGRGVLNIYGATKSHTEEIVILGVKARLQYD